VININELQTVIEQSNEIGLGYPVNRTHAFAVDMNLLGIHEHSLASTFLNNVGSPYHKSDYTRDRSREIEVTLMNLLAEHFKLPVDNSFGYVTSGGTEANFVSIWWNRNYLKEKCKQMPVLLTSSRSHYSFKKIADQLNIEFITIDSDLSGLNLYDLEDRIVSIKAPIIFCANLGAVMDGAIDNIPYIHKLLSKNCGYGKFKIHADGAIYGFMAPYMPEFESVQSIFEYVDTLSFSGHKFLGALHVCGVALTKKDYLDETFKTTDVAIKYLSGAIDATSSGSRSGFLVAELYLLVCEALKAENGKTKLYNLWQQCIANARWFHQELKQMSEELLHYNEGQLSVIFKAPADTVKKNELGKKYTLMPIGTEQFGVYILPSRTKEKLTKFLQDYKEMVKN
jgi:histidine decarboxylase